ncbi:MAG TPA: response regulator transcription factor [Alphaproteobacteria bacterium]|nr:response regulator transcription factor [Alphaproteobacteria bacterium]
MKHPGKSHDAFARGQSTGEISTTVFPEHSENNRTHDEFPKTHAGYWKERLIVRRYRFGASGESDGDLAAYVNDTQGGYFFPLGSADVEMAAAKACRIYQMAAERGWDDVCREFSRELIVSFEWCTNPVLWTYTTIHTLVGKEEAPSDLPTANPNRHRVIVVESDDGIRRALCWSVDHQAGFVSVPCASPESFGQMLAFHKPRMVLLSRKLAGAVGFKSAGAVAPIQSGVPAVTYSVHVDGDKMFVSTPGGAAGYLVKRVPPDRLLEPVLKAVNRPDLAPEELLLRVKHYFQQLLQLPSNQHNAALASLTPREREVLELLSKGYVDKEIAQAMGIGIWTVHDHIKNIFQRLRVRTRVEAAIRYLEK